MRRHANVRAVGLRPRNLSSFRMPRVLEYIEGHNGSCVNGQGGVHIRRGVRPGHARRGRPSNRLCWLMRNCLLSNTLEVGITRDNTLICLSFKRRMQSRCYEPFGINQQSRILKRSRRSLEEILDFTPPLSCERPGQQPVRCGLLLNVVGWYRKSMSLTFVSSSSGVIDSSIRSQPITFSSSRLSTVLVTLRLCGSVVVSHQR